eukprot:2806808-Rhodomonas_salina.1
MGVAAQLHGAAGADCRQRVPCQPGRLCTLPVPAYALATTCPVSAYALGTKVRGANLAYGGRGSTTLVHVATAAGHGGTTLRCVVLTESMFVPARRAALEAAA